MELLRRWPGFDSPRCCRSHPHTVIIISDQEQHDGFYPIIRYGNDFTAFDPVITPNCLHFFFYWRSLQHCPYCSAKFLLHSKYCKATELQHLRAVGYCNYHFADDFIPMLSYFRAVLIICCTGSAEYLLSCSAAKLLNCSIQDNCILALSIFS